MEDMILRGSSPSIDGLAKMINDYYFSDMYSIEQPTEKRFEVWHKSRGYRTSIKVVKQGKRYKFYTL